jgi:3-methylcrotonyl-CoA carboxylase alpha subunit
MKFQYSAGNQTHIVDLESEQNGYRAVVDGTPLEFELISEDRGRLTLRFGDEVKTLYWAAEGDRCWIAFEGCTYLLEKPAAGETRSSSGDTSQESVLRAPMPAQVSELFIQPGDEVEAGEILLVLEAMKMEIQLRTPHGGKIGKVYVAPGESVDRNQVLVDLEEL